MKRGQGAIEYLLLIAAAILVVSIVITAITAVTGEGTSTVDSNTVSQSTQELECLNDINYLGQTGGTYDCCTQGFDNTNSGC